MYSIIKPGVLIKATFTRSAGVLLIFRYGTIIAPTYYTQNTAVLLDYGRT